jgi:hypothetical protein
MAGFYELQEAMKIVNGCAMDVVRTDPWAYGKLSRVRSYLAKQHSAALDAYFGEDAQEVK